MTASTVKVAVLSLLVLQNTSLRLVMKLARTESPDFSATLAVFLCEVVKFGVAFALLARAKGVAAGAADVFAPSSRRGSSRGSRRRRPCTWRATGSTTCPCAC